MPQKFNPGGKTHPVCKHPIPWAWLPDYIEKRKRAKPQHSYLCFLTTNSCHQVPHAPATMPSLPGKAVSSVLMSHLSGTLCKCRLLSAVTLCPNRSGAAMQPRLASQSHLHSYPHLECEAQDPCPGGGRRTSHQPLRLKHMGTPVRTGLVFCQDIRVWF